MFLRRYQRRKNGKPHSYWALVESYRTLTKLQRANGDTHMPLLAVGHHSTGRLVELPSVGWAVDVWVAMEKII